MSEEKVYSLNMEDWSDLEGAIIDCVEGEEIDIYVGTPVYATHESLIQKHHIGNLIDNIQDDVYGLYEDYGDNYLDGFTEEDVENLHSLVFKFITGKIEKPQFYLVENISKERITI